MGQGSRHCHCCGMGLILGPGTSACYGCSKKKKKKKRPKDTKCGLKQQSPLQDFRKGGHGNSGQKLGFSLAHVVCQDNRPCHPSGQDVNRSHKAAKGSLPAWWCREATRRDRQALGSLRPWKGPWEALLGRQVQLLRRPRAQPHKLWDPTWLPHLV